MRIRWFNFFIYIMVLTGLFSGSVALAQMSERMALGHATAEKVVMRAMYEIGNGEVGGDNKGPDVARFMKGYQAPWCAGFVSYVLWESGMNIRYDVAAKKLCDQFKEVETPREGDLVGYHRSDPKSWKGHVGIVRRVKDGYLETIEGNVGGYPARVRIIKRKIEDVKNDPMFYKFVRPAYHEVNV